MSPRVRASFGPFAAGNAPILVVQHLPPTVGLKDDSDEPSEEKLLTSRPANDVQRFDEVENIFDKLFLTAFGVVFIEILMISQGTFHCNH